MVDPQITPVLSSGATRQAQIDADLRAKNDPRITRIARNEEKKENDPQITQITRNGKLYRGRYVEPERISSDEANTSYKVIYCAASLE